MPNHNTTPERAVDYDRNIRGTLPYYDAFHAQALSVVRSMGFRQPAWLDLGCGTGTLALRAAESFPQARFTLADPSEQMLEQAKENTRGLRAEYLCCGSEEICFDGAFHVVTAILSHHYLLAAAREKATAQVFLALRASGVYITFENVLPESEETAAFELRRWGMYQQDHGKSAEAAAAHADRCGTQYFPLTVPQHLTLLRETGFRRVHLFWRSYMQAGFYAIK